MCGGIGLSFVAERWPDSQRSVQRSGQAGGPSEAIEDQVQPERELVAVVVAGPKDVLDGELGEVGELIGRDPVSYTHLDVYKRQVPRGVAAPT